MRNFFIKSLEGIVAVLLVLMIIGIVIGGLVVMNAPDGGLPAALGILIGGAVYVLTFGGMIYLVIGIHDNTRRTAEALEDIAEGRSRSGF